VRYHLRYTPSVDSILPFSTGGKVQYRLAVLYDAHHRRHPEDLKFWLELANRYGDPVLELGCGTGRVMIPLAQAGHTVFGLDRNRAMLQVLKEKLALPWAARTRIFQADATGFNLAQKFGLILFPCNTYSTLPEAGRAQCLRRVRRHLASGGVFVASTVNPQVVFDLPQSSYTEVEEIFPDPESGDPIQASSSWERRGNLFHVAWHYDHLKENGEVERVTLRITHELKDASGYFEEMRDCGLKPAGVYGDFDFSPYEPDSPYLIMFASMEAEEERI
jgi:SAM-dependent methyltransferase